MKIYYIIYHCDVIVTSPIPLQRSPLGGHQSCQVSRFYAQQFLRSKSLWFFRLQNRPAGCAGVARRVPINNVAVKSNGLVNFHNLMRFFSK